MCHNSPETLLPQSEASLLQAHPGMLPSPTSAPGTPQALSSLTTVIATEPEKALLLEAAVDLLQTQKKINELTASPAAIEQAIMNNILSSPAAVTAATVLTASPGGFVETTSATSVLPPAQTAFVDSISEPLTVPIASKEMGGGEKKGDDCMAPSRLVNMSESELINIINPSCFDQGNAFH